MDTAIEEGPRPVAERDDAWVQEVATQAAGAALGIALRENPGYVMPSQEAIVEVNRILDDFGVSH
jgi:hypothetical protein